VHSVVHFSIVQSTLKCKVLRGSWPAGSGGLVFQVVVKFSNDDVYSADYFLTLASYGTFTAVECRVVDTWLLWQKIQSIGMSVITDCVLFYFRGL